MSETDLIYGSILKASGPEPFLDIVANLKRESECVSDPTQQLARIKSYLSAVKIAAGCASIRERALQSFYTAAVQRYLSEQAQQEPDVCKQDMACRCVVDTAVEISLGNAEFFSRITADALHGISEFIGSAKPYKNYYCVFKSHTDSDNMIRSSTHSSENSLAVVWGLEYFLRVFRRSTHLDSIEEEVLDSIFSSILRLWGCGDPVIRAKVGNEQVPAMFAWNTSQGSAKHPDWCQAIWTRVLTIHEELGSEHVLYKEAPGALCRLFDYFFGLEERNGRLQLVRHADLDLRKEPALFQIIQTSLEGSDNVAMKYSLFLLKRVVDFSKQFHSKLSQNDRPWTRYFQWSSADTKTYSAMWDEFFLLFDTMQESYPHLVVPILPKLSAFMQPKESRGSTLKIDVSWWCLLFERGCQNFTLVIRKKVIEYILSLEDSLTLLLGQQWKFLTDFFHKHIDVTMFYTIPGLGLFISPMGEKLKEFIGRLLSGYSVSDQGRLLSMAIANLPRFNCPFAALFILQGIMDAVEAHRISEMCRPWATKDLQLLMNVLDSEKASNVWSKLNSRKYLRRLEIAAIARLTDSTQTTYEHLARVISSVMNEDAVGFSSPEFLSIKAWLHSIDASNQEQGTWLIQGLCSSVRSFLSLQSNADVPSQENIQEMACRISRMIVFLVDGSAMQESAAAIRHVLDPLLLGLSTLHHPYTPRIARHQRIILMEEVCKGLEGLQVGFPIFLLFETFHEVLQSATVYFEAELCTVDDQHRDMDMIVVQAQFLKRILSLSWLQPGSDRCEADAAGYAIKWVATSTNNLQILACEPQTTAARQWAKYAALNLFTVAADTLLRHGIRPDLASLPDIQLFLTETKMIKIFNDIEDRQKNWNSIQQTFTVAQFGAARALVELQIKYMSSLLPRRVIGQLIDELENATEVTAPTLLEVIRLSIDLQEDKSVEEIDHIVSYTIAILEENWSNSRFFLALLDQLLQLLFSPSVLNDKRLYGEGNPVKKVVRVLLQWSEIRQGIAPKFSTLLYHQLLRSIEQSRRSGAKLCLLEELLGEVLDLLLYGPARDKDKDEHKLDAAIALKLNQETHAKEELDEMSGTAGWNFSLNDYIVRVEMNDLLSRLDRSNPHEAQVALKLLRALLERHVCGEFEARHMDTFNHKKQVRLWTAVHVILHFVEESEAPGYMGLLLKCMEREHIVSTRFYIEWAVMRIAIAYPSTMEQAWTMLANVSARAQLVSSLLTVAVHVGDHLDPAFQRSYFEKIFVLASPWTTSHHFTIRLFSQYALFRAWSYCSSHEHLREVVEGQMFGTHMAKFITDNADCIKYREKCDKSYILGGGFDPLKDVTLEFIFRGSMIVQDIVEEERVAAVGTVSRHSISEGHGWCVSTGYPQLCLHQLW
ncbi:uncharacterized protein BJ171DRAFT_73455 [Polychytrium aggregatum]|uniref:uncharacterized protein n=1 Tax=Polychytrium aggregatum TaxID=110093 RepID=UPI0022FF4272|nr:uncharacterized protein BJ171DRAFT_73455 [Polychytrium aggregatum]KAI9205430.1 hypothetical protein BJ171DRAFT_73455 [Polychytrium aggregatum]